MTVAEFLDLFVKELEINAELREYYRLINNRERYLWRRSYLEQRLEYIAKNCTQKGKNVWDAGCGFGTTSIFLALNGFHVYGNTLEFYFDKLNRRKEYWSKYGNLDNMKIEYANLFDLPLRAEHYDIIIVQDTLHHLEPIDDAMTIFYKSLSSAGKLIALEENGLSFFIRMKNFSQRGFKKISEYYDDQLQKQILFGNENARSIYLWRKIFAAHGFHIPENDIEYVRLFPHFLFGNSNYLKLREREKFAARKLPFIRDILFFGINFTAIHYSQKAARL